MGIDCSEEVDKQYSLHPPKVQPLVNCPKVRLFPLKSASTLSVCLKASSLCPLPLSVCLPEFCCVFAAYLHGYLSLFFAFVLFLSLKLRYEGNPRRLGLIELPLTSGALVCVVNDVISSPSL